MTRKFPPAVVQVGDDLTKVAGSYLRSVVAGGWDACATCALPVRGYDYCPKCAGHNRSGFALADRTGYLVYADKGSQAYRTMFDYKEARLRGVFAPTVRGLLAVGLRAHFTCANALAGTTDTGWAIVPSTKGRTVLADLVRGLSSARHLEIPLRFTGVVPGRELNPASWAVEARATIRKHVVLIDDSWVTGASSQSAAIVLKQEGVERVSILSIARVLSPAWEPNPPFIKSVLPGLAYDWRTCPWTLGVCPNAELGR